VALVSALTEPHVLKTMRSRLLRFNPKRLLSRPLVVVETQAARMPLLGFDRLDKVTYALDARLEL